MKKILCAVCLFMLVSCGQSKMAYVNYEALIEDYEEAQEQQESIKDKQAMYTKELEDLQARFQAKVQEYYKSSKTMSASKRTELEGSLQQEQQAIQARQQQASDELQKENQENNDALTTKVDSVVSSYAKTNGYQIVFRSVGKSNIIYGDDTINITEEIVEILNAN